MAYYLIQAAYTTEAWATMVHHPQSRVEAVRPVVESLGGTFRDGWISFGEYDIVTLLEMPDNVSAAAFALAVSSGGSVKALKVTPLLTVEEGMEAMRRAGASGYHPPDG